MFATPAMPCDSVVTAVPKLEVAMLFEEPASPVLALLLLSVLE
jgi:hypothetical protein